MRWKGTVLTLMLIVPACAQWVAGPNELRFELEGVERKSVVHLPASDVGDQAVPLVVFFHGSNETGKQYWKISGWKELAESEGFVAVFPNALVYTMPAKEGSGKKTESKWNNGKNYHVEGVMLDDVAFFEEVLRQVKEQLNIDENRIYLVGFSNGGGMAFRIASEIGSQIAALGLVSGAATLAEDTPGRLTELPPISLILGNKDENAMGRDEDGGPLPLDPAEAALHGAVAPLLAGFRRGLGLSETHTVTTTDRFTRWHYGESENSEEAPEFFFTLVKGMEHECPRKAAEKHWEFFQRHTR